MRDVLRDLRYAARNLRRTPGFALTAVLSLALGIGGATSIFGLVDGVVLRPLPYAEPERLVSIREVNAERGLHHEPLSPVNFLDYRALSHAFEDAAAWWRPEVVLHDEGREPVRVSTVEVSSNFTTVLGVGPVLGAGFPPGPLHAPERLALISHRLWTSRFDRRPDIVGRPLRLNETEFTIAGVMPPGFQFPDDTDVWQRLTWDLSRHSRGAHFMEAVARLRAGTSVMQAQRELEALTARLGEQFQSTNRGWTARAVPLHEEVVGSVRPAFLVLFAAVSLLLVIACINVASLLLARSTARMREVAVRAAIGATRARLIRQFLTESLLLAGLGGLVGVALALAMSKGIVAATPIRIPRVDEVGLDWRVLAFALAATLFTSLLFGVLPAALGSRADVQQALRDGRGQGGSRHRRVHGALVVAEVALAVMLLAGAGLLMRGVSRLAAQDPGFRARGAVAAGVQLTGAAYARWPQVEAFHTALVEAVRETPGIEAAGAANFLPLAPGWRIPFLVRGQAPPARGDEPTAQYHSVSDGWFEALGVPLRRGRTFDARDTAGSRGVVLINEALARRYFPGADPVGRTLMSLATNIGPLGASLMTRREHVIVGVVADVKNASLQLDAEPAIYHSLRQFPFRHVHVVARGADESRAADAVRAAVRRAAAGLPAPEVVSLSSVLRGAYERQRFLMQIMTVFALAALALAALGIYGLLAYTVAERQQELSIRLALGAGPGAVLWTILARGLLLASLGAAVGLGAGYAAARQAAGLIEGVRADDPLAFAATSAFAIAVALAACALPAWRASRLDPVAGLKA